jgi:hypothetical protein
MYAPADHCSGEKAKDKDGSLLPGRSVVPQKPNEKCDAYQAESD